MQRIQLQHIVSSFDTPILVKVQLDCYESWYLLLGNKTINSAALTQPTRVESAPSTAEATRAVGCPYVEIHV